MSLENNLPIPVLRAIDDLRRGIGFSVAAGKAKRWFSPLEWLEAEAALPKRRGAIVSGARARALGLSDEEAAAITLDAAQFPAAQLLALANPLAKADLPYAPAHPADEIGHLALALAVEASLLPALLETATPIGIAGQELSEEELRRYLRNADMLLKETARVTFPIEGAENAKLASFHSRASGATHLALIIGDIGGKKAPLVRVHSSCVTGDILGSLRCDCGDQLQLAIAALVKEGGGILLYLHQEGRGIGITNKLRAYALQEKGMDTYEANRRLGFEEDERDFSIAAAMLKQLGVTRLRLLTNSPRKITGLKEHGLIIAERVALAATPGRHNHAYLAAKAKKSGHLFYS